MNKIKFSHEYSKMPFRLCDMDRTVLMEVFLSDRENLSECFVNYDTHIQGKSVFDDNSFYLLPNTSLIILLLKTFHRIPNNIHEISGIWTTIRRWTPEKEKYYRSIRGEQVEIVVEEQK